MGEVGKFTARVEGRFVDDDDYLRTGRAWIEIDNTTGLATLPVSGEYLKLKEAVTRKAQEAASSATAANNAKKGAESAKSQADAVKKATDAVKKATDQVKADTERIRNEAKAHATAAATAKAGAETAKSGAETAKTGAENAKKAAENAKGGAETAKRAAEAAASKAAETANTGIKPGSIGLSSLKSEVANPVRAVSSLVDMPNWVKARDPHQPGVNTIAVRRSTGALRVGPPTEPADAVNKAYFDEQLKPGKSTSARVNAYAAGKKDTIVARTKDGQIPVATPPTDTWSATSKAYVDGQIATRAPGRHTHSLRDLQRNGSDGTLEVSGRVDGINWAIKNSTIPVRTHYGTLKTSPPQYDDDAVPKKWVADNYATKTHTHTLAGLSDVPSWVKAADPHQANINTIAVRRSTGALRVGNPTESADAVNKGHLDARLAVSTASTGTVNAHALGKKGTIVARSADGQISVADTPSANSSAASKAYVDKEVAKGAKTRTAVVGGWRIARSGNVVTVQSGNDAKAPITVPDWARPTWHVQAAGQVHGSTSTLLFMLSNNGNMYYASGSTLGAGKKIRACFTFVVG
ncbi:hypothetical protein C1Y63_04660 [Corynebacterium sp. 13CS0277]|uniref:hypothetical protein n=1 Tax=Corynebacterium sp. 13CS0277 TaxID=2071994 RepID=UPI000D03EABB|nr:hypothetical protein [Corynebacterium sp. 13CS0277]PRQ11703.1 hypothetical protein C1Y63_04660 [Corynebacterium sp. 13CS0277]